MSHTIAIYSLGCRANQFDSESLYSQFKAVGYSRVSEFADADVHLINTCTVTNSGDRKGRQLIKKVLNLNSGAVVVTGCSAQQDGEALAKLGVDLVVDNANKEQLARHFLTRPREKGSVVRSNIRHLKNFVQTPIDYFGDRTRAHLKIQDGCDQFCTYCIIPTVRGRSRSQEPIELLEQFAKLIRNGYREVVLTGIHVGHYRSQGIRFSHILRRILECPGDFRVRLSSIEPREVTAEVLSLFSEFPDKLCRHLHIAIQSANTEILSRMRRGCDRPFLETLFSDLYHLDPHFGIGIDAIVGFPGESEAQFQDTCDFVHKHPISYGHIFRFSPKKGTPAARYPDPVSESEKTARSRELRKIIGKSQNRFLSYQSGTTQKVIFETKSSGCTGNFTHIKLDVGQTAPIGAKLAVRLTNTIQREKSDKFPTLVAELVK